MRVRSTRRRVVVVALSATLLLGACDRPEADTPAPDQTVSPEASQVNSEAHPSISPEPTLSSIPRADGDRDNDEYFPPNAVIPDSPPPVTSPTFSSTSQPDDSDGDDSSEDDGFPTVTSTPSEPSTPTEPTEPPESSTPWWPPVDWPSVGDDADSVNGAPSASETPGQPTEETETSGTGTTEPRDEGGAEDTNRSWVPVEPTEDDLPEAS